MTPELWPSLGPGLRFPRRVQRVELKILLDPSTLTRSLDPLRLPRQLVDRRQVFFLDTPDLTLHRHRVLLRLRISGRGADLVLKRREPVAHLGPSDSGRRVELDVLPTACLRTVSLTRPLVPSAVTAVLRHRKPPAVLVGREQRELLRAWMPARHHRDPTPHDLAPHDLAPHDLALHGPVQSFRAALPRAPWPRHTSVEVWVHPAREPVVELSSKCRPARAPGLATELSRLVVAHRLAASTTQLTKAELFLRDCSGLALSRI